MTQVDSIEPTALSPTGGPISNPSQDLESLRNLMLRVFPELEGGAFTLHDRGWDCVGVDVDGRIICKFPQHETAQTRLKREAAFLAIIHPAVRLPTPNMSLHDGPPIFSRHDMLPGAHLTPEVYNRLSDRERDRFGADMGLFYAQLHALPDDRFAAVDAAVIESWRTPDDILKRTWPLLDETWRAYAARTVSAWSSLPPDPHETTFGFFDGHGWNMAFEAESGRLGGIYDFGDAGFGPVHQEFIYAMMIAPDAASRIIDHYERAAFRNLDRERIALHFQYFRLSELADLADTRRAGLAFADARAASELRL